MWIEKFGSKANTRGGVERRFFYKKEEVELPKMESGHE